MAAGQTFPAFLKLEHQRDNSAKNSFLAEVASTLDDAQRKFREFSSEAQQQLDVALSVKRNKVGSLDLGVDDLKAAAAAQQARAIAAREVAAATALAAKEEGDYSKQARLAVAATEALAIEEERAAAQALSHAKAAEQVQDRLNRQASATDMVVAATRRGTSESASVINGIRAQRVAFTQLGQQMQDVVVQTQAGTNATTIFVQQVPQMAFALSGLEGNANKAYDKIGKFASFLAGPWGAAVFAAVAVLGPLVAGLIDTGSALDKATDKLRKDAEETEATRQAKELFKKTEEGVRAAILDQQAALDQQQKSLKSAAEQALDLAKANLDSEIAIRKATQAMLEQAIAQENIQKQRAQAPGQRAEVAGLGLDVAAGRVAGLEDKLNKVNASIAQAEKNLTNAQSFFDVEQGKRAADPVKSVEDRYDKLIEQARKRAVQENQTKDVLQKQVQTLEEQKRVAIEAARASRQSGVAAANAANDLGNMKSLISDLFPGARITSTTNHSKYTANGRISDHYVGRAIDFVPAGGVGQYTKAEVEKILEDAGVNIRRNAEGVKQIFGPGDKGHNDHFHVAWQGSAPDPDKVARAAERAQQRLQEFGQRSAEAIAQVNAQFDEQPRLIDQAAQATRRLDAIIADLSQKKPIGFQEMIAEAEAAKRTIEEGLLRPVEKLTQDSERRIAIQDALSKGHEAEAAAMQDIFRLEDQFGNEEQLRARVQELTLAGRKEEAAVLERLLGLYPHIKADIIATAQVEQANVEALRRAQVVQDAYLDATRSVRNEVEAILSGYGKISNFKAIFQQLRGRILAEQLFGDVFRDLDKWVKEKTGIGSSVDLMASELDRAGASVGTFSDVVDMATQRLIGSTSAVSPNAISPDVLALFDKTIGVGKSLTGSVGGAPGSISAANDNQQIVVTANRSGGALTPDLYATKLGKEIVGPLLEGMNSIFGTQFFSKMKGALGGAFEGYLTTGTGFGAVLGGLKSLDGLPQALQEKLGKAFKGAQTGATVSAIGNALGLGLSNTGAQIGGAIGSVLPIPGGDIIGSIAGGLLGKLFGGTKKGYAVVTNNGISTGGNATQSAKAGEGASSIQTSLSSIAKTLGTNVGNYSVSIGSRSSGWISVSASGSSQVADKNWKKANVGGDLIYDGKDMAEALKVALKNAIQDGAIVGIRAGTQRLLAMGNDIDAQLQKAVDFEGVFTKLKSYTDPVGAALDQLDKEFSNLKNTFAEAGASAAEYADLEKLYGIERANAIKQANAQVLSSLQSLYDNLTIGDSGLSLRARTANAKAAYDPLAARVAAGDKTAYEDFAAAAQTYLELQRQMSGSTQDYFTLFNQIESLTKSTIDKETAIANAATNRDSPFSATSGTDSVVSAIDSQTQALIDRLGIKLDAINDNTIALIRQMVANGTYDYRYVNERGSF